eukprot:IDg6993t1
MINGVAGISEKYGDDAKLVPPFIIPGLEARLEPYIHVIDAVRSFLIDDLLDSVPLMAAEIIMVEV